MCTCSKAGCKNPGIYIHLVYDKADWNKIYSKGGNSNRYGEGYGIIIFKTVNTNIETYSKEVERNYFRHGQDQYRAARSIQELMINAWPNDKMSIYQGPRMMV